MNVAQQCVYVREKEIEVTSARESVVNVAASELEGNSRLLCERKRESVANGARHVVTV